MLPLDLTWDAPPECPSAAEVMTELERITRVKPGREVTAVRAEAKIERTADGRYRLRLLTQRESQTGETDLDASSCSVLKRGVTLVLALTLGDGVDVVDDAGGATEDPAEPPVAPNKPEPPRPAPARPAPAPLPTSERGPWRVSPWLAAQGAWGLIQKPSFGPQIGVAVGAGRWLGRVDATFWPPVSGVRSQDVDSTYLALVGGLGGCVRAVPGGWSLAACGAFQVGVIHGASAGAFKDGAASAPWYAVAPSFVVTAPAPIRVRLEASLAMALDPPRFALRYADEIYRVSRFVPAASLGFAW